MKPVYLLVFPLISLILNGKNWYKTSNFSKLYEEYWNALSSNDQSFNYGAVEKKQVEIVDLLSKAGTKANVFYYSEPIGFSQVVNHSFNSFENLFLNHEPSVNYNCIMLIQATEVFKRRFFNSINPISWLETIIFLPQKILQYLGLDAKSSGARILNLIYWLGSVVIGVFVEPVRDAIINWVKSFI